MSDVPADRGFAFLPHTADMTVTAWAPTDTGCLDQAVRGLVAAFAEVPATTAASEVPYSCPPAADSELLVQVLEEVIYLLDAQGLLACGARLDRRPDGGLAGTLLVVPATAARPVGPVPKAVTRHRLAFGRGADGWRCSATVDV